MRTLVLCLILASWLVGCASPPRYEGDWLGTWSQDKGTCLLSTTLTAAATGTYRLVGGTRPIEGSVTGTPQGADLRLEFIAAPAPGDKMQFTGKCTEIADPAQMRAAIEPVAVAVLGHPPARPFKTESLYHLPALIGRLLISGQSRDVVLVHAADVHFLIDQQ